LEEIRHALDHPRFDRKQALLAQKRQLQKRAQQTAEMIRAIDAALSILEQGSGDTMNMKQLFDGFDPSKYEAEAEARWGHTNSYKEAIRRTRSYTREDWKLIQAEQACIYVDAFAAFKAGTGADSVEAMDIAERHRLSIDRWFYPCSFAIHAGLADLYEADSRFAENIDKFGDGLTPFLSAAMRANARRYGG
jgi:MerR family transcriptional regulator, thiopeptide resistance regulator